MEEQRVRQDAGQKYPTRSALSRRSSSRFWV